MTQMSLLLIFWYELMSPVCKGLTSDLYHGLDLVMFTVIDALLVKDI